MEAGRSPLRRTLFVCGLVVACVGFAAAAAPAVPPAAPSPQVGPCQRGPVRGVAAGVPNAAMQEWVVNELPDILDIVDDPLERKAQNGRLAVPDRPGIAVDLSEKITSRYPRVEVLS
jgi:L-alanine-DL-glutamate epimerase-like enolase superfamily enzyme